MVLNIHRNVYLSMNLFIFRRHSPREPAKIVCDNEQGDLFYSEGPQGKFRQPQRNLKIGRGFGKSEGEWTGNIETGTRKKFLAVVLTYSKLQRENICQLRVLNRGDLHFLVRNIPQVIQHTNNSQFQGLFLLHLSLLLFLLLLL